MSTPIRRPEEILAFRTMHEVLVSKPRDLWTVGPADSVQAAARLMDEKNIGCVLVLDQGTLAGILTERDCVRRVLLPARSAEATRVADVMTRDVVTVGLDHSFADSLKLMHQHGIRHLPVLQQGRPLAVVSVRDLAREAVAHHARIIAELERERLTMFVSTA